MRSLTGVQKLIARNRLGRKFHRNSSRRDHSRTINLAVIESLEPRLLLTTVLWTGGAATENWSDPDNWANSSDLSIHNVPTSSDDVEFNNTGNVTIDLGNVTRSVNTLTISGPVFLAYGTLSLSSYAHINTDLTLQRSTLSIGGGLTLSGNATINDNDFGSQLTFSGNQTISGNGTIELTGSTYSGGIKVADTSVLTISSGITVQGGGSLFADGNGTLVNYGVIDSNASGLTLTGNLPITNYGTIKTESGGNLMFNVAPVLESAGELDVTDGSLTLTGNWTNSGAINLSGGTLNLGGNFTTAGIETHVNHTGGTLNITGVLDNTSSTLALNSSTGTINLLTPFGSPSSTIKGGNITESGGATLMVTGNGTSLFDGVNVGGNVTVYRTTLTVDDGLTLSGNATINDNDFGSQLTFSGNQTISGNGTIELTGSTYSGGIKVADTSVLTISSGITVQGGGSLFADGNGTLVNYGVIDSNASGLTLTGNLPITNYGTIKTESGGNLMFNVAPVLESAGELDVTDGSLTLTGNWTNSGAINLSGGTLNLGGNFTTAGIETHVNHTGGTLNITGVLDNTSSTLALNSSTGTINLLTPFGSPSSTIKGGNITESGGATLMVTGNGTSLFDGVNVGGNVTVYRTTLTVDDGLTLSGNATINDNDFGSQLTFSGNQTISGNGTIELTGSTYSGGIKVADTSVLTISSGIAVQGGGSLFADGNGTLVNYGVIDSNASGLTLTGNLPITNYGTIKTESGGNLSLTGGGIIEASGSLYVDTQPITGTGVTPHGPTISGNWTNAGNVTVTNSATLWINTLSPNQDNVWGSGTGDTFSNSGDLNIGSGAAVNIDSAPTNTGNITLSDTAILNIHGAITRGSASALSGTEVAFGAAGLYTGSTSTYTIDTSTDGSTFTVAATPSTSQGEYLLEDLNPNTSYYVEMISTNPGGGKIIYNPGAKTTFNQSDSSGWYSVGSITSTTGTPTSLTSSGNWSLSQNWQFVGSAAGALFDAVSGLVTDGSTPSMTDDGGGGSSLVEVSPLIPLLYHITGGTAPVDAYGFLPSYYGNPQSMALQQQTFTNSTFERNAIPPNTQNSLLNAGINSNNQSKDPVRYFDGSVVYSATDLQSSGFGSAFTQSRSWTNLDQTVTAGQNNGSGMIDTGFSSLKQVGANQIEVISNGTNVITFTKVVSGSTVTYIPTSYIPDELVHYTSESGGGTYVYTDTSGDQTTFNDFSEAYSIAQRGQFQSYVDTAGNSATVTERNSSGNILEIVRSDADNTSEEQWRYSYIASGNPNAGLLSNVQLCDGSGSIIRQVTYVYYETGQPYGNLGDLKTATIADADGSAIDTDYYRYYTSNSSTGYKHGLEYVFGNEAFASLSAIYSDPFLSSVTNSDLAPYADHYFEYNSERQVTKHTVAGQGTDASTSAGLGTYTYSYSTNTGTFDPTNTNNWEYKTVETQPDGSVNTVYCNSLGEVMANVFTDPTTTSMEGLEWITYYQYNSAGQLTLEADPSAVSGINPSAYADLVDIGGGTSCLLNPTSGLITKYVYYTSSDSGQATVGSGQNSNSNAGAAPGYLATTELLNGISDTSPILQNHYTYYAHEDANGSEAFPLASSTVYQDDAGSVSDDTSFTYSWQLTEGSSTTYTNAIASEQISAPIISTAQNGPNSADVATDFFNRQGNVVWAQDPDGYLTYNEYSIATGALTKVIDDVDTSSITNTYTMSIPTGWMTPAGGGLNLITSYVVDKLGRITEMSGPNPNNVTYYIYDDPAHDIFTFAGLTAGSGNITVPAQLLRTQVPYKYAGNTTGGIYTEDATFSTFTLDDGVPQEPGVNSDGSPAISGIQTISRSYENSSGEVTETDQYFSFDDSNYSNAPFIISSNSKYYVTSYGYDQRGRQYQVIDPNLTITDTIYDSLGRTTAIYIGTNDTVSGNTSLPFNGANVGMGNNMTRTELFTYDGGSSGDSNLTQMIQYPDSTTADERLTIQDFDWRDRLIATKQAASPTLSAEDSSGVHRPISINVLDNLGDIVGVYSFDGDGTSMADSNDDGIPDALSSDLVSPGSSASNLVSYSTDSIDAQGRLYQSITYSVDPTTNTISSTGIATNNWYDHRGDVIKIQKSGAATTKTAYDGVGRVAVSYTTDAPDDAAAGSAGNWSDAGNVTGDIVLEQIEFTYDGDGNIILTTDRQRFHNTSGTGMLGTPTSGVAARDSYTLDYYDPADRLIDSVNVGTNGGVLDTSAEGVNLDSNDDGIPDRPSAIPTRSGTVLVTSYHYNARGQADIVTDPKSIKTYTVYDALGRALYTVEAWDGTYEPTTGDQPSSSTPTENGTTGYTYDGDGHTLTMTAIMPSGQDNQITQYIYGVTPFGGSDITSNDLLREVQYPDPITGLPSPTLYNQNRFTYDALGEVLTKIDQNWTLHVYTYDALGRQTLDAVPASLVTPTIGDGDFSTIDASSDGIIYNPTGDNWTFDGNSGVYLDESTYIQAGFLETNPSNSAGDGVVSQVINFTSTGDYFLNLDAYQLDSSQQTIQVSIDGTVVGTYTPVSNDADNPDLLSTDTFNISSTGNHTVTIKAMVPTSDGEQVALVQQVSLWSPGLTGSIDGSIRAIGTSYNAQGLSQKITSYSNASATTVANQVERFYNGLGQLTTEYQAHSGSVILSGGSETPQVQYEYDTDLPDNGSRMTAMIYPNGTTISYSYGTGVNDTISRLDHISEGGQAIEEYQYLGLSTVVILSHPQSGIDLTYVKQSGDPSGYADAGDQYIGLDRFGRIVDQRWIDSSGDDVDRYKYTYDADGNDTAKTNMLESSLDEEYTYDDLNKLIDMTRGGSDYQSWDLDPLGNMDSVTTGGTTDSNTFNDQNERTDLEYSSSGNVLTDDSGHILKYDAWNRLIQVSESFDYGATADSTYAYDGLGRMIVERQYEAIDDVPANPTDLYYSSRWQVIQQNHSAQSGQDYIFPQQEQFIWSPIYMDSMILRDADFNDDATYSPSERTYALHDANFNVTALVSQQTLPGDTNGDGTVNGADEIFPGYGPDFIYGGDAIGDYNHDGILDSSDSSLFWSNYGGSHSASWVVVQRFVYDAYGTFKITDPSWHTLTSTRSPELSSPNYLGWEYFYQGGRYDDNVGLYNFRNREYSPTLMQWMQQDPAHYVDGADLYQSVQDNPISYVDPYGLKEYKIAIGNIDFNPDNKTALPDLRSVVTQIQTQLSGITLTPQDSVSITLLGHGTEIRPGETWEQWGRSIDPTNPPTPALTPNPNDPLVGNYSLEIDTNGRMSPATVQFFNEIGGMNLPNLLIELYGCNTATGPLGEAWLQQIGAITGATVTAGYSSEVRVQRNGYTAPFNQSVFKSVGPQGTGTARKGAGTAAGRSNCPN